MHVDHRKVVIVDGRVGWVGGAGLEDHFQDGRFHDLFLRVTGPIVAQLQLVFLASFAGSAVRSRATSWTPSSRPSMRAPSRSLRSCCTTRPGNTGPSRQPLPVCSRVRRERSTSSIRTSPTADDPPHLRCSSAGCGRAAIRTEGREQLGVRGRTAVPSRQAPRRGRRDPRVPDNAARESTRPRR